MKSYNLKPARQGIRRLQFTFDEEAQKFGSYDGGYIADLVNNIRDNKDGWVSFSDGSPNIAVQIKDKINEAQLGLILYPYCDVEGIFPYAGGDWCDDE